jgi:hypothetical protein
MPLPPDEPEPQQRDTAKKKHGGLEPRCNCDRKDYRRSEENDPARQEAEEAPPNTPSKQIELPLLAGTNNLFLNAHAFVSLS